MLQIHHALGQPVFDRLEGADGSAELQPRLRVLDRQVQQMRCGADLFGGQQGRADLQGVLDHPGGLVRPGDQAGRGVGQYDVACGRVRSSVTSGVRCTAVLLASTAYSATPSEPVAADQQVVGVVGVDHAGDGAGQSAGALHGAGTVRGDRDRRRVERAGSIRHQERRGAGAFGESFQLFVAYPAAARGHQRRDGQYTVPNSGPVASAAPSSSTAMP